jgi:hypothetical protein
MHSGTNMHGSTRMIVLECMITAEGGGGRYPGRAMPSSEPSPEPLSEPLTGPTC